MTEKSTPCIRFDTDRPKRIGLPDAFVEHGTQAQLRHRLGLDDEGVYLTLKALMEEK